MSLVRSSRLLDALLVAHVAVLGSEHKAKLSVRHSWYVLDFRGNCLSMHECCSSVNGRVHLL